MTSCKFRTWFFFFSYTFAADIFGSWRGENAFSSWFGRTFGQVVPAVATKDFRTTKRQFSVGSTELYFSIYHNFPTLHTVLVEPQLLAGTGERASSSDSESEL